MRLCFHGTVHNDQKLSEGRSVPDTTESENQEPLDGCSHAPMCPALTAVIITSRSIDHKVTRSQPAAEAFAAGLKTCWTSASIVNITLVLSIGNPKDTSENCIIQI